MTPRINSKYKDRLFNFIFGNETRKKWTLSLYNAVNESSHTDESQIMFNTLNNFLYVSMKNDTSFIFGETLSLYEHQSTYNPNMPLRMMRYIGNIYRGYADENDFNIYGDSIVELPVPRLVVFYNGTKNLPDETILRLSDSFKKELRDKADIEVKVRMLNINSNHNRKIMEACKPLAEYSWFVDKVRDYCESETLETAVSNAIYEMDDSCVIKPFLRAHMAEVIDMLLAEEQEINALDLIRRAERKEGIKEGIKEGRQEGICGTVAILKKLGQSDEEILKAICEQYGLKEEEAKKYV